MHQDFAQFAVGKGAFVFGSLPQRNNRLFTYVYDCGGSKELVEREIKVFEKYFGSKHDLLVISHFDRDHYSGIQFFEKYQITFKKIIIPCFSTEQFIYSLINDEINNDLLNYLVENRDRVVLSDEEIESPNEENTDVEIGTNVNMGSRGLQRPTKKIHSRCEWNLKFILTDGLSLSQKKKLNAFLRKRNQSLVNDLRTAISNGNYGNIKTLVSALKRTVRGKIPSFDFNLNSVCMAVFHGNHFPWTCAVLYLGDSDLKKTKIRNFILDALKTDSISPSVVQCPHHGSSASHSKKFYTSQEMRHWQYVLIQGIIGHKHHPSQQVLRYFKKLGKRTLFSHKKSSSRIIY